MSAKKTTKTATTKAKAPKATKMPAAKRNGSWPSGMTGAILVGASRPSICRRAALHFSTMSIARKSPY